MASAIANASSSSTPRYSLGLPVPNEAAITGFGGFVSAHDIPLHTLDTALDQIAVLLAGHVAESSILGSASNGSGLGVNSDLSRATDLVKKSLFEWGLGDKLTHISPSTLSHVKPSYKYDMQIEAVLKKQYNRAAEIIENQHTAAKRVAKALMMHRELDRGEITALLGPADHGPPPHPGMMFGSANA